MLNRDEIRQRLAVSPVEVEVESLGGAVFARQLTLTQRRELAAKESTDEPFDSEVWLVMHGVCTESGEPLFQNGDHEWLAKHANGALVTDLAKAVLEANGWTGDAVEEAEGN